MYCGARNAAWTMARFALDRVKTEWNSKIRVLIIVIPPSRSQTMPPMQKLPPPTEDHADAKPLERRLRYH